MPPTLVLLHGFTQTRQSWRRTIAALGRPPTGALAPDLPGHGARRRPGPRRSPPARATCGALGRRALHARGLLDGRPDRAARRARARRPRSTGSCSSARARASPTRPSARRAAPPTTRWRTGSRRSASRRSPREWARAAAVGGPAARASPPPRTRTACATRPPGLAAALRGLGTGVMEPLWDALPSLTVPVTLAVGRARREVPRDRRADGRRAPARRGRRHPRRRATPPTSSSPKPSPPCCNAGVRPRGAPK